MASLIVAWTHGAEEDHLGQTINFQRLERVQHSGFRELCKTGLDDDTFKSFPAKAAIRRLCRAK
jgi:hypothetical protein